VNCQSIRIGGDEFDEAIMSHVKKEYNIMIGERTAEEIKIQIGSAYPVGDEEDAEVRGRDLLTGLPKNVILSSEEIRMAIEEPLSAIVLAIKSTLEKTPPELSSDIMDRGIVMTGGGSLLHGLNDRIRQETGMPVHVTDDPLICVAMGSGIALSEINTLRKVLIGTSSR